MNVAVLGRSHLGTVIAACAAHLGHHVAHAEEPDLPGRAPGEAAIETEPRLAELAAEQRSAGRLRDVDVAEAIRAAGVVWIAYDTPLDDDDRPMSDRVLTRSQQALAHAAPGALVVVSSQLPAGSSRALAAWAAEHLPALGLTVAVVPENLRLGSAVASFLDPDPVVAGCDSVDDRGRVARLLPHAPSIIWTSLESAELTKHARNAFLALSIAFANEIAVVGDLVGADAVEVEAALRSDPRIGPSAYIRAGEPFSGGTLQRDLTALRDLATARGRELPLVAATTTSNEAHGRWAIQRLLERMGDLDGSTVAVLGRAYKAGTGADHGSWVDECCDELRARGATLRLYDPAVTAGTGTTEVTADIDAALLGADAAIVATPWPEFARITATQVRRTMRRPMVIDVTGVTAALSSTDGGGRRAGSAPLVHVVLGRPFERTAPDAASDAGGGEATC